MNSLIFIVLISITGCNEQTIKADQTIEKQTDNIHYQVPDSTYVILDFKSDWFWIFKDANATTLSEDELYEIEKVIKRAVNENNKEQLIKLETHNKKFPENQRIATGFELKTKGYKRQYVPVINSNGQKEVWINFFCRDRGSDKWKSEILMVKDGGNCYFNLKINLETKTYSDLSINGNA